MKIQISIVTVTLLAALSTSCGDPATEETGQAASAFTNEGQICAPGYNPSSPGWPTRGWCQWMSNVHGINGTGCGTSPGVGEVYFFSGSNAEGSCAHIIADQQLVFELLAVNGWYNSLNGHLINIRSVMIGPHTLWQFSDGPYFNGANGMTSIANYTDGVWELSSLYPNFPVNYNIASSANWTYNGGP